MAERLAWAFEPGENKFIGYANFSSLGGTVTPIACRRRTSAVSVWRRTCEGTFCSAIGGGTATACVCGKAKMSEGRGPLTSELMTVSSSARGRCG